MVVQLAEMLELEPTVGTITKMSLFYASVMGFEPRTLHVLSKKYLSSQSDIFDYSTPFRGGLDSVVLNQEWTSK